MILVLGLAGLSESKERVSKNDASRREDDDDGNNGSGDVATASMFGGRRAEAI
jgi:hypothetical protein